jgi:NAD(P)-dependent dehydrogenase (short-subunit alcohol dehydrogenase family)
MNLKLEGRSALVTAGTAGIGLSVVKALANEGVSVTFTGRTEESITAALRTIQTDLTIPRAGNVRAVVADAGTQEGATAIAKEVSSIDILVNNLGVYESKAFEVISDDDWRSVFETNVLSGVRLCRIFLPAMKKRNWGRVLFVSSEAAVVIPPDMIHYAATKSAILSISRGLAETTRGTGVTVNTIIPGPTQSAGITAFIRSLSSSPTATDEEAEAEFFRTKRSTSLIQRLIDPDEVASFVTFFASPLASATNGAALRVEGGLISSIL